MLSKEAGFWEGRSKRWISCFFADGIECVLVMMMPRVARNRVRCGMLCQNALETKKCAAADGDQANLGAGEALITVCVSPVIVLA